MHDTIGDAMLPPLLPLIVGALACAAQRRRAPYRPPTGQLDRQHARGRPGCGQHYARPHRNACLRLAHQALGAFPSPVRIPSPPDIKSRLPLRPMRRASLPNCLTSPIPTKKSAFVCAPHNPTPTKLYQFQNCLLTIN